MSQAVTWNAGTAIGTALSGSGRTARRSGASSAQGIATSGVQVGDLRYWEFQFFGVTSDFTSGGGNGSLRGGGARGDFPAVAANGYLGGGSNCSILANGAFIVNNTAPYIDGNGANYFFVNGDTIGFAVDGQNGLLYYNKNGGVFRTPYDINSMPGFPFYPAFEIEASSSSNAVVVGRFRAGDFLFPPPVGFYALDPSVPIYVGSSYRETRYVGMRTDANLYLGTKALF